MYVENALLDDICYLPAGRSWVRTDLGLQITCLLFSSVEYFVSSFCVEFSLQPFSNLVYPCVWHLGNRKSNQHYTHWRKLRNCLFLRSLFTFYVLCSEKKNCWKRRESWKISSAPYAGSGWEIRFKDLGFQTAQMHEKIIKPVIFVSLTKGKVHLIWQGKGGGGDEDIETRSLKF